MISNFMSFRRIHQIKSRLLETNLHSEGVINFPTLLFFIYLAISVIRFTWPARVLVSLTIAAIGVSLLFLLFTENNKKDKACFYFISFLIASYICSSIIWERFDRVSQNIVFILMSSGIALLLKSGLVKPWGAYFPFYGLVTFFVTHIILGHSPDSILVCSHNGVSLMLLATLIPLYIISDPKKIDLKPAIFGFLLAIWAIGRSGIISSAILLAGVSLIKYFQTKKYLHLLLSVLTIFICLILVIFPMLHMDVIKIFRDLMLNADFLNIPAYDYSIAKSSDMRPPERLGIFLNYYNNLDVLRFFFGVNVISDYWPEAKIFAYNYHNTFINLHAQTGFFGILIILALLASIYFFYRSGDKIYSLLLLVMMIRWSTDIGLFFESWDFIPYFFIFTLLHKTILVDKLKIKYLGIGVKL